MTSLIPLTLAAVLFAPPADGGIHDTRALVDAIEAAQEPIGDFRCEFEGSTTYKGAAVEKNKKWVDENGQADVFAGVFVWKRGGESFTDALHRIRQFDNISNERIMTRPRENRFEHHNHPGGRSVGNVDFRDLDDPRIALSAYDSPLSLFLIDTTASLGPS